MFFLIFQTGIFACMAYVILPQYAIFAPYSNVGHHAAAFQPQSVGTEIGSPFFESASCLAYCLELGHVAVEQQCLESGNVVEPSAHAHYMLQFACRKILVEHCEVVAEVEEGLLWIAFGQCSAPNMIDNALWYAENLASHVAQTPAKVNLFAVREEAVIKSSGLPEV